MGERFGESVWDGWAQEQSEKRIAEMTAQKVLEAQRQSAPAHLPRHYAPPTHKSVLLERWAKDTETMADDMVGSYYDASRGTFFLPDGSVEYNFEKAVDKLIAYLNSAAEGANQ